MFLKTLTVISLIYCSLDASREYTKNSMSEEEMAAWDSFKKTFRPSYYHPHYYGKFRTTTNEEKRRKSIFKANYQAIRNCNSKRQQDPCGHRCGVNRFSDWSQEEFKKLTPTLVEGTKNLKAEYWTGNQVDRWQYERYTEKVSAEVRDAMNSGEAPDSWNWVEQGGVTEAEMS